MYLAAASPSPWCRLACASAAWSSLHMPSACLLPCPSSLIPTAVAPTARPIRTCSPSSGLTSIAALVCSCASLTCSSPTAIRLLATATSVTPCVQLTRILSGRFPRSWNSKVAFLPCHVCFLCISNKWFFAYIQIRASSTEFHCWRVFSNESVPWIYFPTNQTHLFWKASHSNDTVKVAQSQECLFTQTNQQRS